MTKDPHYHWSHGPHYQFQDAIVFITWRLAFTLPSHILAIFKELSKNPDETEKRINLQQLQEHNTYLYNKFVEYDSALANLKPPGFSLNQADIAKIIKKAFHHFAFQRYELHAYTLMANHVHLLIRAMKCSSENYYSIADIVQSLKRYTALHINKQLNRHGQVWDRFYFDRIIRDAKNYANVLGYILYNPVAAGSVTQEEDWQDSFHDESLSEKIR